MDERTIAHLVTVVERSETKWCPKCEKDWPATAEFFSPDQRSKTGWASYCKSCRRCGGKSGTPIVDPAIRFWAKVNKDGPIPVHMPHLGPCWPWTAGLTSSGYAKFWDGDKLVTASRFSFTLAGGILLLGEEACHHCDNPPCVRPDHLFAGTMLDNRRDARSKGRTLFGEKNPSVKLTEQDIPVIRSERANGVSLGDIADRFLVTKQQIWSICHRRTWKHVP